VHIAGRGGFPSRQALPHPRLPPAPAERVSDGGSRGSPGVRSLAGEQLAATLGGAYAAGRKANMHRRARLLMVLAPLAILAVTFSADSAQPPAQDEGLRALD